MISAQYQQLTLRVDALQIRERVLLLIVSIVLLFFLADSIGFQPLIRKQQLLLEDIKEQELQLGVLRARFSQYYGDSTDERSDPLAQLHRELSSFGQKLQFRLDSMLSPVMATSILEKVVTHDEGLILKAVNTRLTPQISIEADTGRNVVVDDINRYELELQLEGSYLDTLYYLRALEALPWKFFWTDISFAVTEFPKASVELEIYTLGQLGN